MPNSVPANADALSDFSGNVTRLIRARRDKWDVLAASAILVLGSPRSGTSWLAKIFDSHPTILYRHEPDELTPALSGVHPATQLATWIKQRGLRSAAKRPWFSKSWRPEASDAIRRGLAATLALAQRLPLTARMTADIGLPDFVALHAWRHVRAAVKLVNWDGSLVARTMPNTRCVFILRHPCGQIASVLAGLAGQRFEHAGNTSAGAARFVPAMAWAARNGVDAAAFDALPDAGKFAWAWRAFNEPAVEAMNRLPNARIVIYEELCRNPEAMSKDLFLFAGLAWDNQTAAFLGNSTQSDRTAGYYDVFRTTEDVAERWRQTMTQQDQDAVRAVMRRSSLAGCWVDLSDP